MKKILLILLLFFFPIKILGIETSADSAILMDLNSNRILYEKNIHKIRSVASISNVVTTRKKRVYFIYFFCYNKIEVIV